MDSSTGGDGGGDVGVGTGGDFFGAEKVFRTLLSGVIECRKMGGGAVSLGLLNGGNFDHGESPDQMFNFQRAVGEKAHWGILKAWQGSAQVHSESEPRKRPTRFGSLFSSAWVRWKIGEAFPQCEILMHNILHHFQVPQ